MTHEELARILEQFAIVVLKTGLAEIHPDHQYKIITSSIDTIVETVMFCADRERISTPSMN